MSKDVKSTVFLDPPFGDLKKPQTSSTKTKTKVTEADGQDSQLLFVHNYKLHLSILYIKNALHKT